MGINITLHYLDSATLNGGSNFVLNTSSSETGTYLTLPSKLLEDIPDKSYVDLRSYRYNMFNSSDPNISSTTFGVSIVDSSGNKKVISGLNTPIIMEIAVNPVHYLAYRLEKIFDPTLSTDEIEKRKTEFMMQGSVECVYWDTVAANWSTDGCFLHDIFDGHLICHCNHMTDFATRFLNRGLNIILSSNYKMFLEPWRLLEVNYATNFGFYMCIVITILFILLITVGHILDRSGLEKIELEDIVNDFDMKKKNNSKTNVVKIKPSLDLTNLLNANAGGSISSRIATKQSSTSVMLETPRDFKKIPHLFKKRSSIDDDRSSERSIDTNLDHEEKSILDKERPQTQTGSYQSIEKKKPLTKFSDFTIGKLTPGLNNNSSLSRNISQITRSTFGNKMVNFRQEPPSPIKPMVHRSSTQFSKVSPTSMRRGKSNKVLPEPRISPSWKEQIERDRRSSLRYSEAKNNDHIREIDEEAQIEQQKEELLLRFKLEDHEEPVSVKGYFVVMKHELQNANAPFNYAVKTSVACPRHIRGLHFMLNLVTQIALIAFFFNINSDSESTFSDDGSDEEGTWNTILNETIDYIWNSIYAVALCIPLGFIVAVFLRMPKKIKTKVHESNVRELKEAAFQARRDMKIRYIISYILSALYLLVLYYFLIIFCDQAGSDTSRQWLWSSFAGFGIDQLMFEIAPAAFIGMVVLLSIRFPRVKIFTKLALIWEGYRLYKNLQGA